MLGLFEYYPALDQADSSAQLMAEMVWCFLDGMEHRSDDHPLTATGVEFKQYIVPLEELEQDLVFHKCKQTDRWWIELPCSEEQKQRYGRHCYLASLVRRLPDRPAERGARALVERPAPP